jgi:hypothetical protein
MTSFLTLLLLTVFSTDYLATKLQVVPRAVSLVPEVLMIVVALVVVGRGVILRRWEQTPRFAWTVVAILLVCMIGVVAETMDPGPLVLGIREYFKFLPLILLPAVYRFSDKQLKFLLGAFLFFVALQVPLAFFQRFVQFSDRMHTGDPITGTLSTSSALTMMLCLAIALVMTLYVQRKISLSIALVAFCFLASPTAINETKATLLLLPIATVGPFLVARGIEGKWRMLAPVIGICMLGLVAFAAVYNTLIENRWGGRTIGDFITTGHFETYLYRGTELGAQPGVVGRLDSMILPVNILSENWMQLLFGLGIGNVSPSSISSLEGAYAAEYGRYGFGMTSIGNLIWEVGLIGLVAYCLLFYFMWREARNYSKSDDEASWIGTWWSICVVMLFLGLAYKSILNFPEIAYMLFFWSGLVGARSWQARNPERVVTAGRPTPRLQLAGAA